MSALLSSWSPPVERYDLIATQFFLDCFPREQLGAVIEALQTALRPGASWLVSDFQIPKGVSGGCALGSSTGSCMASFGLPQSFQHLAWFRPGHFFANTASSACGVRSSIGVCSLPSFGGAPSRPFCSEGVVAASAALGASFNGPRHRIWLARKRRRTGHWGARLSAGKSGIQHLAC